ncbi:FecR domain-containing protein [Adhaeretor mobilis]|uniref:FecR protein n=1 Tax=Adhaeretor mobilis TaxID=1930276 RepID=A0A517MUQ2_9BACT|nr:FecR domain-containing protein [Adhaeretor mobilis]QDS98613.1 FecR protein [Adhaeretor mobilis]
MDKHIPRENSENMHPQSSAGGDQYGQNESPLDSPEKEQLNDLLSSLCDGMLNETDANKLHELLRRSKEARSTYIQYLHMHASVAYSQGPTAQVSSTKMGEGFESPPPVTLRSESWKSWIGPRFAASVAAIVACIAAWVLFSSTGDSVLTPFGRSRVHYVASIVQQDDCHWGDGTVASIQGGMLKSKDQLNLLEGLAKLRFDCGAEIIVRGPAKLRIDSGMDCFLSGGELSAVVPEVAQGFTVDTPLGRVVDLGTAFGVNVGDEIEVQVFEGELELHPERRTSQQPMAAQQSTTGQKPAAIGLVAGAARKMVIDEQSSLVRVSEITEPLHQFPRSLPQIKDKMLAGGFNGMAIDSFGQGSPGTRLTGRNGGFGWSGSWINTPDSNSVSFMLGSHGAISRGSGDGVVERRLGPSLAPAELLYFSAEFQLDGPDDRCSAWLELFKFIPHYWSNGDGNLAVIGITDGQFSGRLAPFGAPEVEQSVGDCGQYAKGSRHLIVGKLEMDAVGDQERLSIWINPTLADESTPKKVIIRDTGQPGADAIAIRCWEMDDRTMATLDEVRVSHKWIDVVQ